MKRLLMSGYGAMGCHVPRSLPLFSWICGRHRGAVRCPSRACRADRGQ